MSIIVISIHKVRNRAKEDEWNLVLKLGQNDFVSKNYSTPSNARRAAVNLKNRFFPNAVIMDNTKR